VAIVAALVDRQQFHGRHAQTLEMIKRGGRGQPGIGPAEFLGNLRIELRKTLHVHFVNDRLVPGTLRRPVIAPGEGRIDHDRQGGRVRIIAIVEGQVFFGIADLVAPHLVAPAHVATDPLGVGIEHHLIHVEAMTVCRLVWPADAVAVELARPNVGQVAMPDQVAALGDGNPLAFLRVVGRIKQAQFDFRRAFGKQREVSSVAVPRCPQGIRFSWPNSHRFCCIP
jgi:hypothetical protein